MTRYAAGKAPHADHSRSDFAGSKSRKQRRGKVGNADPQPAPILIFSDDLVGVADMPKAIFGQYPQGVGFIERVLPWLLCERREIVHVCSGALPPGEGIRVDVRADAKPDIIADGRSLPFESGSIAAVMIDPPYTEQYANDLYGVEYPRPRHLLIEAARVVRRGGADHDASLHCAEAGSGHEAAQGVRRLDGFQLSNPRSVDLRARSAEAAVRSR